MVNRRGYLLSASALLPAALLTAATRTASAQDGGVVTSILDVATADDLRRTNVSGSVFTVRTAGFARPDDRGGALYRRAKSEPSHPGKVISADGAIWELVVPFATPEMFGARGGEVNDRIAIQAGIDYAVETHGVLRFPQGRYSLAGHVVFPSDAERFVIEGSGFTELVQLQDNASHFYFAQDSSSLWTIRSFTFKWSKDQSPKDELSYAIRFNCDTDRNWGHWNFEVSDCMFWNGFRGIGTTPTVTNDNRCPIWGAHFRNLRCSQHFSGAVIHIQSNGRFASPNILIEHFYARCDSMVEPAIDLSGCDTVIMTALEFNKGSGRKVLIRYSRNIVITGIRFEEFELNHDLDDLINFAGASLQATIIGLVTQTVALNVRTRAFVLNVVSGASVRLEQAKIMLHRTLSDKQVINGELVVAEADADSQVSFRDIAPFDDDRIVLIGRPDLSRFHFESPEIIKSGPLTVDRGADASAKDSGFAAAGGVLVAVIVRSTVTVQAGSIMVHVEKNGRRLDDGPVARLTRGDVAVDIARRLRQPGGSMLEVAPGDVLSCIVTASPDLVKATTVTVGLVIARL
jgi:hypothetical protein